MSAPSLPSQFINWRLANQHQEANAENQQRSFLQEHLRRKELMENLSNHPGWKLMAEFLAGAAEAHQRKAEEAPDPHTMATNLMLAKAYRSLVKFPADTIAFAENLAKQQPR